MSYSSILKGWERVGDYYRQTFAQNRFAYIQTQGQGFWRWGIVDGDNELVNGQTRDGKAMFRGLSEAAKQVKKELRRLGWIFSRGDLAVLSSVSTSVALRPEDAMPDRTVYTLVQVQSVTRQGGAKTMTLTPGGPVHKAGDLMLLGENARHPALLAFYNENDLTEVKLGYNKKEARQALQNIISAAESGQ